MKIAAAAACLALSLAPAAHAAGPNLVVNGSFEDSVIPTGTWVIQPSIKGWTGAPDIELQRQLEGNLAQDGQQLVELDTFGNKAAMSQTINATGWVALSFGTRRASAGRPARTASKSASAASQAPSWKAWPAAACPTGSTSAPWSTWATAAARCCASPPQAPRTWPAA